MPFMCRVGIFFVNILLSFVSVFCYDNLLIHEFNFISMEKNYCFGDKIHFHFHVHLFYTFILMPYGIMGNFRSEQLVKLFTYFYTKMKKLRISYERRID